MIPTLARRLNNYLSGLSSFRIGVIALFMTMMVGIFDHITGYEISFSIFYIAAIGLTSWYVDWTMGLFFSTLSAVIWLIVDLASGHPYSHFAIPFWNAMVRLAFFIVIALLLSKLRSHLKIEQKLARLDGLTGLLNGFAFRDSGQSLMEFCRRTQCSVTICFVDLDDFKKLNDSRGHDEGDRALITVGKTLKACVRSTDLVSRLGGDEFALLLPDTSMAEARIVVEKIHGHLASEARTHQWPIGFSIGVATLFKPPATVDDAIKYADQLMYRVKKAGKNSMLFEEYLE